MPCTDKDSNTNRLLILPRQSQIDNNAAKLTSTWGTFPYSSHNSTHLNASSEEEGKTWTWISCGGLLQLYWAAMSLYFGFSREWMSGIMLAQWGKRHAVFLQVIWDGLFWVTCCLSLKLYNLVTLILSSTISSPGVSLSLSQTFLGILHLFNKL